MVVGYITAYSGFEVALRRMAEANGIAWPVLPFPLEYAQEDKDLGVAVALAAAMASFLWPDAPGWYLNTIAVKELRWRHVDLLALMKKAMEPSRYDKVANGALTAADLGFTHEEMVEFFRDAKVNVTVHDTFDMQAVGKIRSWAAGEDERPVGMQLGLMHRIGIQTGDIGRTTKASR